MIDLAPDFIKLCLTLVDSSKSLAFHHEVFPHYKEFCLVIDPLFKDQICEEMSLCVSIEKILNELSMKLFITTLDKSTVENALIHLHIEICKCLIIKLQSNLHSFSLKGPNKQNLIQAIQTLEYIHIHDRTDYIRILNRILTSLLNSNLAIYYKPVKDPLKIKLLNALEVLCKTL